MDRTEFIQVRVSKLEKTMFDKAAKLSGMTVSDYVRAGGVLLATFDRIPEALEITAAGLQDKFGHQVEAIKLALGLSLGRSTPVKGQG